MEESLLISKFRFFAPMLDEELLEGAFEEAGHIMESGSKVHITCLMPEYDEYSYIDKKITKGFITKEMFTRILAGLEIIKVYSSHPKVSCGYRDMKDKLNPYMMDKSLLALFTADRELYMKLKTFCNNRYEHILNNNEYNDILQYVYKGYKHDVTADVSRLMYGQAFLSELPDFWKVSNVKPITLSEEELQAGLDTIDILDQLKVISLDEIRKIFQISK